MMKRNITIVGIVLILIAIILISGVGSRVESPSAEVREPVALEVVNAVVEQVSVNRLARREVAREVSVPTRTLDAVASVGVNEVDPTVAGAGRVAGRRKQVGESAVVLRANVRRADQDQFYLV